MYHTTGLTRSQITELCAVIHRNLPSTEASVGRPRAVGVFTAVRITLTYLRRNLAQHGIAELVGVSQATVSRVIAKYTPLVKAALVDFIPVVDDLDHTTQLLIDGTLLPTWSWRQHPNLYSGKHRTTGMNIQVATDLNGRIRWISDALPGSIHDSKALRESGLLDIPNPPRHIADKGYIGLGLLTPNRKPAGGQLQETEKELNTQINEFRAPVERAIANLKTWRILHTDYRRPLNTIHDTLAAVIGLEFYRTSF